MVWPRFEQLELWFSVFRRNPNQAELAKVQSVEVKQVENDERQLVFRLAPLLGRYIPVR